ncbi:MmoB/DmpM family protein [Pseudonocardia humida]|uniref:MmoB/DmpM family protein n=1 Tax=Pseudonocardia humida TaxID=2800819 RepID=A0ABT0ZT18_9PSEU|nr:MmoB/DmpM family protein [Pseudonocardia humida]MCO1653873.1 MmoB/DmpM family protein [Pseudonocardia humida]
MSHHVADPAPRRTGDDVSIVLRAGGGRVDLVIAAIRDDNPDVELHVVDHGDLVDVSACRRLLLTVRSLRWQTGWDLGAHDVWAMIVSFRGTMTATADRVMVTSGGR